MTPYLFSRYLICFLFAKYITSRTSLDFRLKRYENIFVITKSGWKIVMLQRCHTYFKGNGAFRNIKFAKQDSMKQIKIIITHILPT